jgi:hypothetical protein
MICAPSQSVLILLKGIVMKRKILNSLLIGVSCSMLGASSLMAHDGDKDRGRGRDRTTFVAHADLVGAQENPLISTDANGHFHAVVDTVAGTITWTLRYDALEGNVTQAHVHIGQRGVNGGISFFMCTNAGNAPVGAPVPQACPAPPAEISGVLTADDIIGPTGQGIPPDAFAEVVGHMRDGNSYANVHSSVAPGGEIRGQLH